MPVNRLFPPEGLRPPAACTRTELEEALAAGTILEGVVQRCDAAHTLHLSLGGIQAQIPRQEAIAPWDQRCRSRYCCYFKGWKANLLYCKRTAQ